MQSREEAEEQGLEDQWRIYIEIWNKRDTQLSLICCYDQQMIQRDLLINNLFTLFNDQCRKSIYNKWEKENNYHQRTNVCCGSGW